MSSSPCPSIHAYAKFSPLLRGLLLSIEDDSPTKGHREIRHDLHLGYLSETVCDHGPNHAPNKSLYLLLCSLDTGCCSMKLIEKAMCICNEKSRSVTRKLIGISRIQCAALHLIPQDTQVEKVTFSIQAGHCFSTQRSSQTSSLLVSLLSPLLVPVLTVPCLHTFCTILVVGIGLIRSPWKGC